MHDAARRLQQDRNDIPGSRLEIMEKEDVAWWRRRLADSAVRTFGRSAWRG